MKQPELSFLIDSLNDGGSERQLLVIIQELIHCGLPISVFNWAGNSDDKYVNDLKEMGVKVYFLESLSKRERISQIRNRINTQNKALISFSFHLNFVAVLSSIGKPWKAIGSIRSSYDMIEPPISAVSKWLHFFCTKRILSNNQKALDELLAAGRKFIFPGKLTYLSNRIRIPATNLNRSQTDSLHTVSVGRIDDNKRIDWIIHAIHQLRQSGYSVKHKHAGDGIRLNEMKQLVRSLGMEEHIEFLGRVNDIPRLLQKSDLFIHAAYSEGSPNVLMEAGAHGLPVVSSDCGDAPVVIPNGKAGYITPVHDRDAWYKRIEELAADPEKRVRLGNTAYHHVRDRFSVDTLRRDLISLFQTYNIQLPCAE